MCDYFLHTLARLPPTNPPIEFVKYVMRIPLYLLPEEVIYLIHIPLIGGVNSARSLREEHVGASHLPGIEKHLRVKRLLDCPHNVERLRAVLSKKKWQLSVADSVLPGARASHLLRPVH